ANTHIHTDNQADAGGSRALDHVTAQIVAFANAVRNMKFGYSSAHFNRSLQDDDGGGPIHVIVTVDQNSFVPLNGGFDALDRSFHSQQTIRRMQVRDVG